MVFKNIESYSFDTPKIIEIYNFYNKYILSPSELIMHLMQNKERRVKRKSLFEFEHRYKDKIAYELQSKNNIECYDEVMRSYPKYPVIIYTYILKYKQLLKIFVSTKMKSLRNINNRLMIFIIFL